MVFLFAVLSTALVIAGGSSESSGPIVWKFSTFDAANSDYAMAYRAMWDKVEEESEGRLKIELYDLGQLGGEADIMSLPEKKKRIILRRVKIR